MGERPESDGYRELTKELDALLDGIGRSLASSSEAMSAIVAPARSGRLYHAITRHWPRVAAGLVGLAVAAEWLVGGLSADGALDFYVTAWAAATAGVWFLFDKAERSLTGESRATVAAWLADTDVSSAIASIPAQFAVIFDKVFGERHLTLKCLARSSVASIGAIALMMGLWVVFNSPVAEVSLEQRGPFPLVDREPYLLLVGVPPEFAKALIQAGVDWHAIGYRVIDVLGFLKGSSYVLVLAVLFNFIPDYLSLWETRAVLGWMAKKKRHARALLLDVALTFTISMVAVFAGSWLLFSQSPFPPDGSGAESGAAPMLFPRAGVDNELRSQLLRQWGTTYPSGPVRKTAQLAKEVVTLEPRFGSLLMPVVPTVARVELDGSTYERWPILDPPAMDGRFFGYEVRSIEERRSPSGGRIVTIETLAVGLPFGLFFYSAFLTSAWLWLYGAAVLASRVLLRMNRGLGFLLNASDVEHQPFRSMGFVSVLLVTGLFALGLPLLLL